LIDSIENFCSINFKIDLSTAKFLTKKITSSSSNIIQLLSDNLFINDTIDYDGDYLENGAIITPSALPTLRNIAVAFLKLTYAAKLISTYNLNSFDVEYIENNSSPLGIVGFSQLDCKTSWYNQNTVVNLDVSKFIQFVNWMQLNATIDSIKPNKSSNGLFAILSDVGTQGYKISDWNTAISYTLQTPLTNIETLVGKSGSTSNNTTNNTFNINYPPPVSPATIIINGSASIYLNPTLYWKVIDAIKITSSLQCEMSKAALIAEAIVNPNNQQKADIVISTIKAQYETNEWLNIVQPINDKLRIGRRDVMIDFLLANPVFGYDNVWKTADDIYETLLIDVQIMPCMLTSRIRAAMSSVQLFIERCLLNLEKDSANSIVLTSESARQWRQWRKYYRVWEANRKVFLYPENWIEPELRDNKTPFFKDLEKYLKQNEITQENMEDAYLTYIEKLESVSHLDIVGTYTQKTSTNNADDIVHVWGRTRQQPHIYYYRFRKDNEWSAWEKMDVQIDGDHLIPVIFRGRLRLYWLIFTETPYKGENEQANAASTNMKIELAWTELKNKKWQPKSIGKEVGGFGRNGITINTFYKDHLICYAFKNLDGDLEIFMELYYPFYSYGDSSSGFVDDINNSTRILREHFGSFVIKHGGVHYVSGIPESKLARMGSNYINYADQIIPSDTLNHNCYYRYITDFGGSIGRRNVPYKQRSYYYNYHSDEINGYKHNPDINAMQLLGRAPHFNHQDLIKIIMQRAVPETQTDFSNLKLNKFFYQDYKNSFFVEKVSEKVAYTSISKYNPLCNLGVSVNTGFSLNDFTNRVPNSYYENNHYRFHTFYHYNADEFGEQLFTKGIDGLLDLKFVQALNLSSKDSIQFDATYQPTNNVAEFWPSNVTTNSVYPSSKVDFSFEGAYSIYNWELFYHIPMLIANKLMKDQKFFEAMKWYHYIFNPTITDSNVTVDRFWRFLPFNEESHRGIPTLQKIMESPELAFAVKQWANNPFKPHLVARNRISAYMKNTVMKYLDNLIAWGDMKFRQFTMESINDATMLYVIAAKIMGRRPVKIPKSKEQTPKSYDDLVSLGLNAFSNAIVEVENVISQSYLSNYYDEFSDISLTEADPINIYYFCLPPNEKLLTYWDIVADRLFKIRH
ncbi:MAG: hypothetical protein RI955_929, partial [Bacteroidota bacterium]